MRQMVWMHKTAPSSLFLRCDFVQSLPIFNVEKQHFLNSLAVFFLSSVASTGEESFLI